MSEWIKCSERLPDVGEDVLINEKWSSVPCIAWITERGVWLANKDFVSCDGDCVIETDIEQSMVTHWMPLPAAPEAE